MWPPLLAVALLATSPLDEGGPRIRVDAGRTIHRVSPLLAGACIEDVNHEIYGGLYSQMIFGESFQEPPPIMAVEGFTGYGGEWAVVGDEIRVAAGAGPKLVLDGPAPPTRAAVEVRFPTAGGGNAGLIVQVDRPKEGADAFLGYEVSLETAGRLVLGRHRRNWEPLRAVPCAVPVDRWVDLAVEIAGPTLTVSVDGKPLLAYEDRDRPLAPGQVGLRAWQRPAHYRNLRVEAGGAARQVPFRAQPVSTLAGGLSGPWRPIQRGAWGTSAIATDRPFVGRQSQRLVFERGAGEVGIENRGLNRWGLHLVAGKPYEGTVWARAARPTPLTLALESGDGAIVLASSTVDVPGSGDWTRRDFTLTPTGAADGARFAIKLTSPGTVDLGYASLQPGEWGRYKGLPVRKDVVEAMLDQGISVLRYGGSMVNRASYRWKGMIGPRDRRPPYDGHWYPYSSNGWGILDFLDLAEAMGIPGIPAFFMGESPADMADFVRYVNGPADSEWGRRRAADGHPEPYRLTHLELGNEEKVDAAYWDRFRATAEAIWAVDPGIILVVGDFLYKEVIADPYHIRGSDGADSLAVHKQILELARARGREVWFDIHTSTDHPPQPNGLLPERSYVEQLGKLVPGASFRVAIFEYNSGNHAMKRALSNALAHLAVERIGPMVPVACSANCLQPDGQNDNGWDQGLLFLDPARVWLQPPGHLTRLIRRHYQPNLVQSEVAGPAGTFDAAAQRSDDGTVLVLQVVNATDAPQATRIELANFAATSPTAVVEQLAGPLEATNTAAEPGRIAPTRSEWRPGWEAGGAACTFPPRSVTFIEFR